MELLNKFDSIELCNRTGIQLSKCYEIIEFLKTNNLCIVDTDEVQKILDFQKLTIDDLK